MVPIPRKELTVERLERAIQQVVTDEAMHRRAREIGARIRAEDGVGRAVAVLENNERSSISGRVLR